MKNEVEISNEIKQLERDYSHPSTDKKDKKRAQKRATFLKNALLIIAKCPNEQMVLSQSEKAKNLLNAYKQAYQDVSNRGYPVTMLKTVRAEVKAKYNPELLKQQIEIARFVLEK